MSKLMKKVYEYEHMDFDANSDSAFFICQRTGSVLLNHGHPAGQSLTDYEALILYESHYAGNLLFIFLIYTVSLLTGGGGDDDPIDVWERDMEELPAIDTSSSDSSISRKKTL